MSIASVPGCDGGAGAERGGLAIGYQQKVGMAEQGDQIVPGRHVEWVVGPIAGDSGTEQWHAAGVKGRQGLLKLEQVGALIFTMAELEQGTVGLPAVCLGMGHIKRGGIHAGHAGGERIDAHDMPPDRLLHGGDLACVLPEHLQEPPEPVVGDIRRGNRPPRERREGGVMGGDPIGQCGEPMVAFVQHEGQEEHGSCCS